MPTKKINGATVTYGEFGAGETVALLHCSSSTHRQWRGLWEILQDRFRIVAHDLYGYGGTDPWSGHTDTLLTDEGDLVRALTDDCEDGYHLAGHSYGGTISARLALATPARLKSLILIEPTLPWLLDPKTDSIARGELKGIADTFRTCFEAGDPEPGAQNYFDFWNGVDAWRNSPEELRRYCLETAEKTYQEFAVVLDKRNQVAPLAVLTMPVLIVRGENTRAPAMRVTEILLDALPHAHLAEIPGAGHMSPITHTKAVNAEIKGFLDGIS